MCLASAEVGEYCWILFDNCAVMEQLSEVGQYLSNFALTIRLQGSNMLSEQNKGKLFDVLTQ